MYLDFFGLHELPFELTPNPKFVFMTARHREALSNLQYGLSTNKAVTLLIGEVGTGKTTLLHTVLESETCRHIQCLYINNPALTRSEFIEMLAQGFGLSGAAATSKTAMLAELKTTLQERRAEGRALALVVDEAQALSNELLEEIRLLANLETSQQKLLPLVLSGQPELAERLRLDHLRQLRQRVSLRCEIGAFDAADTAAYIAHRIGVAGGQAAKVFTREAVTLIHHRSRGIPRTINVLCDNALVGGFAEGIAPVTARIVGDVCRDFAFDDPPAPSRPAPLARGPETGASTDRTEHADAAGGPVLTRHDRTGGPRPSTDKGVATRREMFVDVVRRKRFFLFG